METMPGISVKITESYLGVEIEDDPYRTIETAKLKPFFEWMLETAKAAGLKSILIDARSFKKEIKGVERVETGGALARACQFHPGIKMCFLTNTHQVDEHRLVELLAVNRGARVSIATDKDQAISWLTGG